MAERVAEDPPLFPQRMSKQFIGLPRFRFLDRAHQFDRKAVIIATVASGFSSMIQ